MSTFGSTAASFLLGSNCIAHGSKSRSNNFLIESFCCYRGEAINQKV